MLETTCQNISKEEQALLILILGVLAVVQNANWNRCVYMYTRIRNNPITAPLIFIFYNGKFIEIEH
jgi:hypothetical protein